MKILVVGYGFAGASLSYFLSQRNIKVDVISNPIFDRSSSSAVSAGIMLPFSGKRKTLSYNISNVLPFALKHYEYIQNQSGHKLLYDLPVRQIITEARDYNEWFSKSNEIESSKFLNQIYLTQISDKLKKHIGYLQFNQSNAVSIHELLKGYRKSSINLSIHHDLFSFDNLKIGNTFIIYNNIEYDQLVFCEGYRTIENKFWKNLPFQPVKGEIVDIHAPDLNLDFILNSSIYIIPLGSDRYKVGATYNWKDIDEIPSREGVQMLKFELDKMISVDYQIIGHQASVRPAIQDRKPVIGFHPEFKSIGIFNGLGTKGAMLSPYYANMMANYMIDETPIDKDVSVDRFSNLFKFQNQ